MLEGFVGDGRAGAEREGDGLGEGAWWARAFGRAITKRSGWRRKEAAGGEAGGRLRGSGLGLCRLSVGDQR